MKLKFLPLALLAIALSVIPAMSGCQPTGTPSTQPAIPNASSAQILAGFETANAIAWPIVVADHNAGNIDATTFTTLQASEAAFLNLDAQFQASIKSGNALDPVAVVTAVEPLVLPILLKHGSVVAKTVKVAPK